jgi:hypothetical protein
MPIVQLPHTERLPQSKREVRTMAKQPEFNSQCEEIEGEGRGLSAKKILVLRSFLAAPKI